MHYAKSRKALEKETTGRRRAGEMDDPADRTRRCGVNLKLAQLLSDLGQVVSPHLHYLLSKNQDVVFLSPGFHQNK